ncbi:kinesin-like protein KIN-10C isoform X2 [Iris pallida]|uniref:Kinesin-like protein KIN-10C isoform X2 n=1 Tax=Iris pallida TaxID=29817 RepID=A0AAX6EV15_IRIPA|nr:kinesin-like protein KIN-10C isoform X2 [Iris pallida]
METPVSRSHPNPRHGVRVVGKIRPFLESEAARSCPILMGRSGDGHASVFFGDQNRGSKGSSKLDWCYGPEEGVNDVFSNEVKPLLQGLLEGRNSCVIAYGAPGSGKTQLIQGTEESPGLALLTVTDIFPVVEELGGSINISCYEVYQDHVYDLLEPKGEVLVMEDANQRIQLKGLSQVPVKSISEFKDLFLHGCDLKTPSQNIANDVMVKSHRGVIIYVSCVDKESKQSFVAKINFVDLAGYEDIKKKHDVKCTLAESAKVNKSLYSLLNVVQAVNSNQNYVSYRESKLTRLLQDFISRSTGAVLVTCMSPVACLDTVHAVHLASRSCQMVNQHHHDSIKSSKNASRNVPSCSPMGRVRELDASLKKLDISQFGSIEKKGYGTPSETNRRLQPSGNSSRKPGSAIHASFKKLDMSQLGSIEKKGPQHLGNSLRKPGSSVHVSIEKINNSSLMKGRKLFNLKSPCIKVEKKICASDVGINREPSVSDMDVSIVNENEHSKIDDSGSSALEVDAVSVNEHNCVEGLVGIGPALEVDVVSANEHNCVPAVESKLSSDQHDDIVENLNHNPAFDVAASTPLLTDKLREISNSLKLWSNKPIGISTPQDDQCKRKLSGDTVDPQTPVGLHHLDYNSRFEDVGTPQDKWRTRSTGLKKSLVQECLTYLNSANKEELKALKGIGEKRATYILELREETPEPFKDVDDLKDLGLSSKQIRGLMSKILGDLKHDFWC